MPGLTEILLIGGLLIFFFGASRLPALMRSLGEARHEFKRGRQGLEDKDAEVLEPPKPSA